MHFSHPSTLPLFQMRVSALFACFFLLTAISAPAAVLAQSAPPPANAQKPAAPQRAGCQTGTPEGELACLKPDLREVEQSLERQVHRLNRLLHTAERSQGTRASARLIASQTEFYDYRNHYCKLEGVALAGVGEWLDVRIMECEMRLTKDRLEALRDIEVYLEG